MRQYRAIALAALLGASSYGINAAELPAWYPEGGFSWVGSIDAIDLKDQTLVVGDLAYRIGKQLVVHSPRSTYSMGIGELQVGQKVGIGEAYGGEGLRTVSEIWLLPNDYVKPNEP